MGSGRLSDTWRLDEVFIRINGQEHYLWRAVKEDADVIDILVQPRRDQRAAERFFRRLRRGQGKQPFPIVTDKLRSYSAAVRRTWAKSPTSQNDRPTIVRKSRVRLRANENGKCADSNPLAKRSGGSSPSRRRPESLPTRTALAESDESSTSAFAILRDLADCHSGVKPLHDNQPRRTKMTLPAQVDDNAGSSVRGE
jgi:transposase-like protein